MKKYNNKTKIWTYTFGKNTIYVTKEAEDFYKADIKHRINPFDHYIKIHCNPNQSPPLILRVGAFFPNGTKSLYWDTYIKNNENI